MDGVAGVVSLGEFLDEGTDTALGGGGRYIDTELGFRN